MKFIKKFKIVCNSVEKFTFITSSILLIIMLLVGWTHVFSRYFLNNSLTWSEEFLRYSLVYYSLLSASVITRKKGHIGVVVFREKMPKFLDNILTTILTIVELFTFVILFIAGINLIQKVQGQLTPAMNIEMAIPFFGVTLSFLFMAVYSLEHFVDSFFKKNI